MERWPAGAYDVTVYRSDEAEPEQEGLIKSLARGTGVAANANVQLSDVNVSHMLNGGVAPMMRASLPLVQVGYPGADAKTPIAWVGELRADEMGMLLDSPARREIARRLMAGTSAVYVVLEGGDAARDAAGVALVEAQIKKSQKQIQLPDLNDPNGAGPGGEIVELKSDLPLKVEFSTLRISRSDPAEKAFVQMLMGIDHQVTKEVGPAVYVVFGAAGRYRPCLARI